MILEIVTPEAVLYKGNVSIITLPGAKGSFQILENHAPIVALLEKGIVTFTESEAPKVFAKEYFPEESKTKGEHTLSITGGVVEQKDNKIIVLAQ
ncbi:F0F1 ATP synthase subunit epsilon [uncultured Capnocytophaga sp.]|jgi:ATP synthase, delta/epsilon subunit, beta-sandwich domain protein|uniref:F0F1 ATP synthase subunit epsilon n=1 Tax=uncultured Capnocytophaga sp. TaxID=159273 RepID=UPI002627C367|nr:F0F1 ATP synthase subunit epsilon [uncultured Capnocytophaga sp.]